MKAIADATGRTPAKIKEQYTTEGDLGSVAQSSRSNQSTMFQPAKLTVPQVFKTLKEIASISGGSVNLFFSYFFFFFFLLITFLTSSFLINPVPGKKG